MFRSSRDGQRTGVCGRHPVFAVAILQLTISAAIVFGVMVLVASGNEELASTDGTAPVRIGFGVLAPALVTYLVLTHKGPSFGFRKVKRGRWLAYVPAALVLGVTIAMNGLYLDQSTQVAFGRVVLLCLLVGFVEETIYRGMMLRLLLSRSATIAVLVSTVLFGLSHSLNLAGGQSLTATVAQIAFALAFGFSAAMMWLVGKSIWPLIVFHVVYNFTVMTGPVPDSSPVTDVVNSLILLVGALVLIAWYRADRRRPEHVAERDTWPIPDEATVARPVGPRREVAVRTAAASPLQPWRRAKERDEYGSRHH